MSIENVIKEMAKEARRALRHVRGAEEGRKNAALELMAARLLERETDIIKENEKDLATAREAGLAPAMLDRLTLDKGVIHDMARGLNEVAALPDPVGQVPGMWRRPNGLLVGRVRIPLGVIGFIYESRPNVTVDAAGLCLKSGNAVILKGGSEAIHSNVILGRLLAQALKETGLPPEAVQVIPTTDREAVSFLIGLEEYVDV
ncbi:MAG: aldehyde dehydrogenase family protein, partial [Deltaproteobacteria bacterium]|nr:aldehyde dehydrogenase family protein [Deltaproteobacteria bacterium]